jgi:O-antigen/teichoic acid export membrane protein
MTEVDDSAESILDRLPSARLIGRAGWGVFDQGFVSLANFGLGVVVARLVSPDEFGAFGVAFAVYLVALNVSRGFATQPLTIRFGTRDAAEFRRGTAESTGLALMIGVLSGLVCLLLAAIFPAPLSSSFVGLAIALPGLLLQDAWRFVLFTARRGQQAMLNDLVWTIVLVPLIWIVVRSGQESVLLLIVCWGAGAAAAAVVGAIQAGGVPRVRGSLRWWREHIDITPRFLSSELVQLGGAQLVLFAVGALVGLAGIGSIRGAQLLLGPFNVLSVGVHLTMVPEAARLIGDARRLRRLTIAASALLGGAAVLWGTIVVLLPDSIGRQVLGATWDGAHTVLLPVTISMVVPLLSTGPRIALRALEEAGRTLQSSFFQTTFTVVGGIGGALMAGVVGAAWGLAIAAIGAVVVWWFNLSRAMGQHVRRLERRENGVETGSLVAAPTDAQGRP